MIDISIDNQYRADVYTSISDISEDLWNNFHSIHNEIYQHYAFLQAVEQTQQQLQYRYLVVFKEQTIIGIVYFQYMLFDFNNLIQYDNTSSIFRTGLFQYLNKQQIYLLHQGNVFFTGDNGIVAKDTSAIIELIPKLFMATNSTFSKSAKAFLVTDITLSDERTCTHYPSHGFHQFSTEPDLYFQLNSQWNDFNMYLANLSSKYRVRAKKVMQQASVIKRVPMNAESFIQQQSDIKHLYEQVMQKADFKLALFNLDFYLKYWQQATTNMQIIGYYLAQVLVGFIVVFGNATTLHIHYVGLDYNSNKEYKLYNAMLYDVITMAIEQRVELIHFGRTATEIKTTVGARPKTLNAYLKFNNRIINWLLPYFLKRITIPEFVVRNPFKDTN